VQILEHQDSPFWQMLDVVLRQFDGLVAGYQARHHVEPGTIPQLSRRDFVFLNGNGESYFSKNQSSAALQVKIIETQKMPQDGIC
jgi:hypothetical protein